MSHIFLFCSRLRLSWSLHWTEEGVKMENQKKPCLIRPSRTPKTFPIISFVLSLSILLAPVQVEVHMNNKELFFCCLHSSSCRNWNPSKFAVQHLHNFAISWVYLWYTFGYIQRLGIPNPFCSWSSTSCCNVTFLVLNKAIQWNILVPDHTQVVSW